MSFFGLSPYSLTCSSEKCIRAAAGRSHRQVPRQRLAQRQQEQRRQRAAVAVEPAADELDPAVYDDRVEARSGRRKRGRILTFLGHVIDELRRVQWPDRRHVGQGTAVVLGFVIVAGSFLGLMDAIWKPLVEALI